MSIPKEPRQLMINLMYLVLTAMLALNISSEILNAFKTINDSIEKTNSFVAGSNGQLYNSLDAQAQDPAAKARVEPFRVKAQQVKAQADAMVAYLDGIKNNIVKQAGGINKEGHIEKEGDIDIATRMFVEGESSSKKGGDDLRNKLQNYRSFLLNVVNPNSKNEIEKQLPLTLQNPSKTENNPNGDWATGNFFHMPTIAAVTLFSKYINDVRNSEGLVVQQLMNEAQVGIIKFNAIQAIATPTQSYVRSGDKVGATILLAAYNQNINPRVSPDQGSVVKVENGVAYWEGVANGAGPKTVHGTISLEFNGRVESKPFEFKYTVGNAGGSIQLDKLNVMYVGLDNPVTISASGYNIEDANLSIPGAQVTKVSDGHYMVKVSTPGQSLTGTVIATGRDGKSAEIAKLGIRVKPIPDPVAEVAQKHGGVIAANVLRAQQGIVSELKDFLFEGVRYTVTSFSSQAKLKRSPELTPPIANNGPVFNPQVKEVINQIRAGDRIFFDDIKAVGPDGRPRNLGSIAFTII